MASGGGLPRCFIDRSLRERCDLLQHRRNLLEHLGVVRLGAMQWRRPIRFGGFQVGSRRRLLCRGDRFGRRARRLPPPGDGLAPEIPALAARVRPSPLAQQRRL